LRSSIGEDEYDGAGAPSSGKGGSGCAPGGNVESALCGDSSNGRKEERNTGTCAAEAEIRYEGGLMAFELYLPVEPAL